MRILLLGVTNFETEKKIPKIKSGFEALYIDIFQERKIFWVFY